MSFEKFARRNELLSERLARIAGMREQLGLGGAVTRSLPSLRAVLAAQERLLVAAENLLDAAPRRMAVAAEARPASMRTRSRAKDGVAARDGPR